MAAAHHCKLGILLLGEHLVVALVLAWAEVLHRHNEQVYAKARVAP
jgi:hypothetical protein